MVGIDSWVRPGQKHGENHGGLAGAISPGFDGGGFRPDLSLDDVADLWAPGPGAASGALARRALGPSRG